MSEQSNKPSTPPSPPVATPRNASEAGSSAARADQPRTPRPPREGQADGVRAPREGQRRSGQVIIGFAAETETDREALLELGRAKVRRKGSDFLVLNTVGWTEVFNTESTAVILLDHAGAIVGEASGTKTSVADRILDLLS